MKELLKKVGCSITIIIYIGLLCFAMITMVSSCSKPKMSKVDDSYYVGYDDGYNDGYDYGHEEGIYDDWEYNIKEIGQYFEEEAVQYVKEQGGWHPEEAWMIIDAYQTNEPFYQDGSPPSEEDYLDAVESLIYFYDYFYSAIYGSDYYG